MFVPFIELVPEIKNNYAFRNSIPTTVDKNLIRRHVAIWHGGRIFWMYDFDIAIIILSRFVNFNGSRMLLGNTPFRCLHDTGPEM